MSKLIADELSTRHIASAFIQERGSRLTGLRWGWNLNSETIRPAEEDNQLGFQTDMSENIISLFGTFDVVLACSLVYLMMLCYRRTLGTHNVQIYVAEWLWIVTFKGAVAGYLTTVLTKSRSVYSKLVKRTNYGRIKCNKKKRLPGHLLSWFMFILTLLSPSRQVHRQYYK
jgi:hypothetical protein